MVVSDFEKDMNGKILIINGPNLNMLGTREPEIYGRETLEDVKSACVAKGESLGFAVDFRQSNHEGDLVSWIQEARQSHAAIVINPAAYSHTSVAILDALLACGLPVIEVHLSNIFRREEFRHHSFVSRAASGIVCGLGKQGYLLALEALASLLGKE